MSQYISSIQEAAKNTVGDWSKTKKDSVFYSLQRGTEVLTTPEQLLQYIYSFGSMHFAKLNQAFDAVPALTLLKGKHLEVIDYGCGQGFASIALTEYFKTHSITANIDQFTLIEPSRLGLEHAQAHLNQVAPSSRVKLVNKYMDSISQYDLQTSAGSAKIHLFSNILDMESFSIENLAEKIINSQQGENIFICVSPKNTNAPKRITAFMTLLNQNFKCKVFSERETDIKNQSKYGGNAWTRFEKCFAITL